jgi:hypothetical protein
MIRMFVAGAFFGGTIVWLCQSALRERLAVNMLAARVRAAEGLQVVEERADALLVHASEPLRRAEKLLDHTREKIGTNLRACQERLRPATPEPGPSR